MSPSKKLRVGIVGCGKIAAAHAREYQGSDKAQIVSVYDTQAEAAQSFAGQYGAQVAPSLREMIADHHLDAVSVCSPPAAHKENCLPFLEAKIPVLCEKPIAPNAETALELADAAYGSGTLFMMAFCHRFHPAVIELKKLIDGGVLGKPLLFRNIFGGFSNLAGNHRVDPALSGGGCLIDHCCHSLDLFRFLVGDPTHAQALAGNIVQDVAIEDFGLIHLSMNDKTFGEITASYSLKSCANNVQWYGTEGAAIVGYDADHPDLTYKLGGQDSWTTVDCTAHPGRFGGEIEHFMACIAEGATPSITASDGLKASRIVAAVYESVAQGRKVEVKYDRET